MDKTSQPHLDEALFVLHQAQTRTLERRSKPGAKESRLAKKHQTRSTVLEAKPLADDVIRRSPPWISLAFLISSLARPPCTRDFSKTSMNAAGKQDIWYPKAHAS
jgi:hypothetical protein